MPPTITPSETAMLTRTIQAITAAQKTPLANGKFRQARSGRDAEFLDLGVAAQDIADGRGAGGSVQVNEYDGPSGNGWEIVVLLSRAGTTWRYCHHVGPETYRAHGWVEVTDGP
jgi:hypothetical protein